MPGQAKKSAGYVLSVTTNLLVIGVAVLVLVRPDSTLRSWWKERRNHSEVRGAISELWPELTNEGGRLGHGRGGATIIEFGDYQCPACRVTHRRLKVLLAETPGLTVVYRHMPVTALHPRAEEAARASICAERMGFFQDLHDYLYDTDDWMEDPEWGRVATQFGALADEFEECLRAAATAERLARDTTFVRVLRLSGTPAFIGPEGVHIGGLDEASLGAIIRGEKE